MHKNICNEVSFGGKTPLYKFVYVRVEKRLGDTYQIVHSGYLWGMGWR